MNLSAENHESELAAKREQLLRLLAQAGRVGVAFSGGVDSAVVAKAAQIACGDRAVAVTAVSLSLADGELEAAIHLAQQIGIRHRTIETREFENPLYIRNSGDRCYHCKSELYSHMETHAVDLGVDVIVNGANLDDLGDYRPGMSAAREWFVRSPLIEAGFRKVDVRALARFWELPVSEKPATPCLSSRIAYGLEVTAERVRRVDQGETFLKELLGNVELRVRHEQGDLARIEVPPQFFSILMEPDTRTRVSERFRELGFRFVTLDLDGFRSGSMNSVLPIVTLDIQP